MRVEGVIRWGAAWRPKGIVCDHHLSAMQPSARCLTPWLRWTRALFTVVGRYPLRLLSVGFRRGDIDILLLRSGCCDSMIICGLYAGTLNRRRSDVTGVMVTLSFFQKTVAWEALNGVSEYNCFMWPCEWCVCPSHSTLSVLTAWA
jgi:hypothetical protein